MINSRFIDLDLGNKIEKEIPDIKAEAVLGPYDFVIEVKGQNEDDIYDRYVDKINRLEEVGNCITYIVVHEKKYMPKSGISGSQKVYLLMDTTPVSTKEIAQKIYAQPEVEKVDTLYGPFDILARILFDGGILEIREFLKKLQKTMGVLRSITMIALPKS